MRRRILFVIACLGLSGCAALPSNPFLRAVPDEPLPYGATLSPVERGRPAFSVVVDARGAPLAAFRESARFQGTRYCLRHFGSSEIVWRRDPARGDWALAYAQDGRPVVSGRCTAR